MPTFLGGRAPDPPPRPVVKHFKVFAKQCGRKNLFALAPKERRKWWSMQQLVDFFGTDSLERHFVGVEANLSTPYNSAVAVRHRKLRQRQLKPLLSKVPSYPEDRGRCSPLSFSVAVLCMVAVAWALVYTERDGNVWQRCRLWLLALTTSKEPAIKMYGLCTFVAMVVSVAFLKMKPRQEDPERTMAQFTAEQAEARAEDSTWEDSTWDDMLHAAEATPPATNEGSGSEGVSEDVSEDEAYDTLGLDRSHHVVCTTGRPPKYVVV